MAKKKCQLNGEMKVILACHVGKTRNFIISIPKREPRRKKSLINEKC